MTSNEARQYAKEKGFESWIKSEVDIKAVAEGCYFDINSAERVKRFFRNFLKYEKGKLAGLPYSLMEFQWLEIIAPLFGWKRKDGTRRYREAFIFLPKKNDKSGLASGIADYLLVADGEVNPLVLIAGYDRTQATEIHKTAWNLIKKGPARKYLKATKKEIICTENDGLLKALSKDSGTAEGLNWSGLIFEELHTQRTWELWDCLKYGGDARKQPLLVSITTAGDDKNSVCYSRYEYAKRVAKGEIEDIAFLPVIYEASEADDISKPETWKKANPALDIIFSTESMSQQAKQAATSLRAINAFKRYKLNIWTSSECKWLDTSKWLECKQEAFDITKYYGKPCIAALDLSQKIDLTAFVLTFRENDIYTFIPYFWTPELTAESREATDRVPYRDWERKGYVEFTQGNSVDFIQVRKRIESLRSQFNITEIVYDDYAAGETIQQLVNDGAKCVPIRQNINNLSEPSKTLEKLIIDKRVVHGNNLLLNWMIDNVQIYTDSNGNIRPVRYGDRENRNKRIDGVICMVMTLARWAILGEQGQATSSWNAQIEMLKGFYK